MNHMNNKGSQNHAKITVISMINQIILKIIPTVATVIFKKYKNKNLFASMLVLIEEKSSKNSDFKNFVLFLIGVLL